MICIKCGKEEGKLRRAMCLSCYRKDTGFSRGDSTKTVSTEVAILNEILELKDRIKIGKEHVKQLPKMQERFKMLKIKLSEAMK